MKKVSGIILAGGKSRRLGRDKALIRLGTRTLIEIVLDKLRCLSDELILSTNEFDKFAFLDVPMVRDIYPRRGVLGGLYSGLQATKSPFAVVVACDMPFLNLNLLRFMILQAQGYDVVVPRLSMGIEPLHAIYARTCLEPIRETLEEGRLRIVDFWEHVRVRYIEKDEIEVLDPKMLSFFNINTPEDLDKAREIMASAHGVNG